MLREIILIGMLLATVSLNCIAYFKNNLDFLFLKKVHGVGRAVPNDCLNAFRSAILSAHNGHRSLHHTPALTQDNTIGAMAQEHANSLADDRFKIINHKGLGANIHGASPIPYSELTPL
jgi:hypothetical protein